MKRICDFLKIVQSKNRLTVPKQPKVRYKPKMRFSEYKVNRSSLRLKKKQFSWTESFKNQRTE